MEISVEIDDGLLLKAKELTGILENSKLMSAALTSLVEMHAAQRLFELGGTMPELEEIPRRRFS